MKGTKPNAQSGGAHMLLLRLLPNLLLVEALERLLEVELLLQ